MNGLIIQWGRNAGEGWERTTTLPIPFSNTNYIVVETFDWGTAAQGGWDKALRVSNKTTTSFKGWQDAGGPFGWIAIGY